MVARRGHATLLAMRPHAVHAAPASRRFNRPGFSLIEVVIAIAIVGIGLSALAASAGFVVRLVGDGGRRGTVAMQAQTLLDSLRARPCAAVVPGADTAAGRIARWAVTNGRVAQFVTLTVAGGTPGMRPFIVSTGRPCRGA
jgi:prepilin-type N-terminal cleavage/methylation domain-containing protein